MCKGPGRVMRGALADIDENGYTTIPRVAMRVHGERKFETLTSARRALTRLMDRGWVTMKDGRVTRA